MKFLKPFIISLLTLYTANGYSQKILTDKYDNGGHNVSTDIVKCFDGGKTPAWGYGVWCYERNKRHSFELVVEISCDIGDYIESGGKVLIRTFRGNTVTAEIANNKTATDDFMYILIPLSHDQLYKVALEGIRKIRIECNSRKYFERIYKTDTTSELLKQCLHNIDRALPFSDGINDDFSNGF